MCPAAWEGVAGEESALAVRGQAGGGPEGGRVACGQERVTDVEGLVDGYSDTVSLSSK